MATITSTTPGALTAAAWAGDYLNREHLLPGGVKLNAAAFAGPDAIRARATANTAVGATAIPVAALSGPIPSGAVLLFGDAIPARLTAAAATGAPSLAVRAMGEPLASGIIAVYSPGRKTVPAGTLVGRTFAEVAAGAAFGPAEDGDDEVFLVAFDVTDADRDSDATLYRPGSIVRQNLLPGWAGLSAALQGKLRAAYVMTTGGL